MYYLVVVQFEEENAKGQIKKTKTKFLVEAESVEEATIVSAKYCEGDMRSGEVYSITKMPLECVIDRDKNRELYR